MSKKKVTEVRLKWFREGEKIPSKAKYIKSEFKRGFSWDPFVRMGEEQYLYEVEYEENGFNPAYSKRKTKSKTKT